VKRRPLFEQETARESKKVRLCAIQVFICIDQVDAKDNTGGRTALFVAAAGRHEGSVKLLLEHGADPDIKVSIDSWAAGRHKGSVKLLLEHGADPDIKVSMSTAGQLLSLKIVNSRP
jgi:ankyrin repeat protein